MRYQNEEAILDYTILDGVMTVLNFQLLTRPPKIVPIEDRSTTITVRLNYFTPTGKWYTDAQFLTTNKPLYEIWEEVDDKLRRRRLPGLVPNHSRYMVVIDVPEHEHNHPHLLID